MCTGTHTHMWAYTPEKEQEKVEKEKREGGKTGGRKGNKKGIHMSYLLDVNR